MITIVSGQLCCVWGLALCGGSTDSGLRIRATDVGGDSSKVVVYGGQCYTILTNITTCGTIITPGSVVASCADAACATVCPPCGYSDVLSVGGLDGQLLDCFFGGPVTPGANCSGCSIVANDWDGTIHRDGQTGISCGDINPANGQPADNYWQMLDGLGQPCNAWAIHFSNGSTMSITTATLSCIGGPTGAKVWQFEGAGAISCFAPGQPCTRGWNGRWQKALGTGPTGTYTRVYDGNCCDNVTPVCPATITIS